MIIRTDYEKDKFKILHAQEISGILDANNELRKGDGWDKKKDFRHLARIPTTSYLAMIKKYPGVLDGDQKSKDKAIYEALKDPEFSVFQLRHE